MFTDNSVVCPVKNFTSNKTNLDFIPGVLIIRIYKSTEVKSYTT